MRGERNRRGSIASAFAIVAVAIAILVIGAPGARAAGGAYEFVADTNSARTDAGLPGYAYASDLSSVALRQAQRMAADGQIYHNANLGTEVANWSKVAENVGAGANAGDVHEAFMASSSHRDNILSPVYTEIGVGTATGGDGRLYVAEVFRLPDSQPEPASEPAPEPASDAAPAEAAAVAPPAPVTPPSPPTTVAASTPVAVAAPVAAPIVTRTELRPTTPPTTELRPRLAASVTRLPVLPRRANPLVLWVAAFLAQLVLVAHMVTFWRRYRMGSGW